MGAMFLVAVCAPWPAASKGAPDASWSVKRGPLWRFFGLASQSERPAAPVAGPAWPISRNVASVAGPEASGAIDRRAGLGLPIWGPEGPCLCHLCR